MDSIQEQLIKKIEALKSLDLAKSHLEKIEIRIKDLHHKSGKLQVILEKEYDDVEQLEKLSVRSLFEKMLQNHEAQLEKERQEYLQAALNYNECKNSLELLDFERKILRKKLTAYNETKSELHNLIRQREHSLIKEDVKARVLITSINADIDAKIAFKRELYQAIELGNKIKQTLENISTQLEQVSSWGAYSVNASPDKHIRKMAYVSKARNQAYIVKQLLEEFEDELTDIYNDEDLFIKSSLKTFHYFIYDFFDNLISDWIVLMKLENTISTIKQVKNKVIRISQSLNNELKKSEFLIEKLTTQKEELILNRN